MIPVYQTDFGPKTGNCWPATIASILEISQSRLHEIPNFCQLFGPDEWLDETNNWLIRNFGVYVMSFLVQSAEGLQVSPPGFHGIGGKGPRGVYHACVGYRGEIVHDPFARGESRGLMTIENFDVFIPCDPTQSLTHWKQKADFRFHQRKANGPKL